MFGVRRCLGVTREAGKFSEIGRVWMTRGAQCPLSLMGSGINLEVLGIMIERGRQPGSHGMAGPAIMAKVCGDMVRVGRFGEIGCMALVTIGKLKRVI